MVAGIKTQGVLAIVEKVNGMLMSYECVCIYMQIQFKGNFLVHTVEGDNIFELISEGKK